MTIWTIALVMGISTISLVFILLSIFTSNENKGIKTLMIMFSLGSLIILSQTIKSVLEAQIPVNTNLILMGTSALIMTIVLFCFFMMYFLIYYTVEYFKNLRNVREGMKSI